MFKAADKLYLFLCYRPFDTESGSINTMLLNRVLGSFRDSQSQLPVVFPDFVQAFGEVFLWQVNRGNRISFGYV